MVREIIIEILLMMAKMKPLVGWAEGGGARGGYVKNQKFLKHTTAAHNVWIFLLFFLFRKVYVFRNLFYLYSPEIK